MTDGDSCPFAAATVTTPAPDSGIAAGGLPADAQVAIVLVVLVAAAAVLNRGGSD